MAALGSLVLRMGISPKYSPAGDRELAVATAVMLGQATSEMPANARREQADQHRVRVKGCIEYRLEVPAARAARQGPVRDMQC